MSLAEFSTADLQDRIIHVLFDDEVSNIVLMILLAIRLVHSQFAFEGADDDFVFLCLSVVIDVGDAD